MGRGEGEREGGERGGRGERKGKRIEGEREGREVSVCEYESVHVGWCVCQCIAEQLTFQTIKTYRMSVFSHNSTQSKYVHTHNLAERQTSYHP